MRLYDKPAHVLHDMLVKKEITSVELTKDVISRIDEVEDDVKAYLSQTRDEALKQAEAADARIAKGEEISFLEGIPGAIKVIRFNSPSGFCVGYFKFSYAVGLNIF